jgi:hypothetical protein
MEGPNTKIKPIPRSPQIQTSILLVHATGTRSPSAMPAKNQPSQRPDDLINGKEAHENWHPGVKV